MIKRKALEKKMGAIDNSHSPQEWTALSTPQKITVLLMRPLQQRLAMPASPFRAAVRRNHPGSTALSGERSRHG
ncbi:hypothetical protein P0D88_29040 [Paraburkholderia sp. RL18-103-BIB-C]|jgi:hypothetical protein|uniref:hypothetical protein n=1 Tax=unclassified Paraburkholderia TaxID=2615204 RepID=UPI0038B88C01